MRHYRQENIIFASGANVSEPFNMAIDVQLMIVLSAAWTAASLGFQIADGPKAASWAKLRDEDGAIVEITGLVAGDAFVAPSTTSGLFWLKLWSQTAGANVNQAAERVLTVYLKS